MTSPQQLALRKPVWNTRKYNQGICKNPIQFQGVVLQTQPGMSDALISLNYDPWLVTTNIYIQGNLDLFFSSRYQIG